MRRRRVLCGLLAAITGCAPSPPTPPSGSDASGQECAYEIVTPDTSPAAGAFRQWLRPRATELFGREEAAETGDVFIANLDNQGNDEFLFALHEGSGNYLNVTAYRRAGDQWSAIEPLPFEDRLIGAREYSGPLLREPQFIVRLCGKTIVNLLAGNEPNYYPDGLLWDGDSVRRVCTPRWLEHHRAAAADLVKRDMLDEARVLLEGVQRGCEKDSPGEVRAMKDDIASIAARTSAASAASFDFSWILREARTNPNSQLVLDGRFSGMLVTIVPDAQLGGDSLRGALKKSLWLPDDPKIIDDRYIVISGCEPHNCSNRGLVWIDIANKHAIAMTGGVLASKTLAASDIPAAFWNHTLNPADPWADETVGFIGRDGRTTVVRVP